MARKSKTQQLIEGNAGQHLAQRTDTTKQQLLRSAIDSVGLRDVSRVTMASPDVVEGWMNGQASVPEGKLLVLAVFLENLGTERRVSLPR